MKVKCVRLIDSRGQPLGASPWLTLDKIYHVLSVTFDSKKWLFRIKGDGENGVALFPREQFEIISPKIPDIWIMSWGSKDTFQLTTAKWNVAGFWERYYDGEPEAIQIFEMDMRKIVQIDP